MTHAPNGMPDPDLSRATKTRRTEKDLPNVPKFFLDLIQNADSVQLADLLVHMTDQNEIFAHGKILSAVENKVGPIANFALAHADRPAWFTYIMHTTNVENLVSNPKVHPDAILDGLLKKDTVHISHVQTLFNRGLIIKNNPLFANILFRDAVLKNSSLATYLIMEGADIFTVMLDDAGNQDVCAFAAYRRGAWETLKVILNEAAKEAGKKDGRRYVVAMKKKKKKPDQPDEVEEVMVVDWLIEKRSEKVYDVVFGSEYFKKIQMAYKPATIFHAHDSDYGILHKWILRNDAYFLNVFMKRNIKLLQMELECDLSHKYKGYTALHIAACYPDNAEILKLVLNLLDSCENISHSVDVPGPEPHFLTPLYLAVMTGKVEMVRLLLDRRADITIIPKNALYPPILNMATLIGNLEIIDALLSKYSTSKVSFQNFYVCDVNGFYPLDYVNFAKSNDPVYGGVKKILKNFMKQRSKNSVNDVAGPVRYIPAHAHTKWIEPIDAIKQNVADTAKIFHPDTGMLSPVISARQTSDSGAPESRNLKSVFKATLK